MKLRIPIFLRPVAKAVKYSIRSLVYWRLAKLPLSIQQAEFWAAKMKAWPAIFVQPGFSKEALLPPGIKMRLGLIDVIERNLTVHGAWDAVVGRSLETLLRPGDTFLDIGANIGYFSLYAAKLVGAGGKVIAVEPSRRALEKLLINLRLNSAENVLILSVAAGDQTERAVLNLACANNIGASSLRAALQSVSTETVAVIRLDDVIVPMASLPDLIKIDIEGSELNALRGMEEILKTAQPFVLVELTDTFLHDSGHSALQLVSYMDGLGFRCYELSLQPKLTARLISGEIPNQQTEVLFTKQNLQSFDIEVMGEFDGCCYQYG